MLTLPLTESDEPLSDVELSDSAELLAHFVECVGSVPPECMALMKEILLRRDGAARLVLATLTSCCGARVELPA